MARFERAGRAPTGSARRSRFAAVVVTALLVASPVVAQESGTIRGTVTLVETGGLVDGVVILILGTGAFALTEDGRFEITNVPVGSYEVTAQRDRLAAASQTVAVTAGGTAGPSAAPPRCVRFGRQFSRIAAAGPVSATMWRPVSARSAR